MSRTADPATALDRWPDLRSVPRARFRATVAAALLRRTADRLGFGVEYPDGHRAGAPRPSPTLTLHRPESFLARVGAGGLIGFGEAYQAGDWDSDDLHGLLVRLAENAAGIVPAWLQWLRRFYVAAMPGSQDNTRANAARNIGHHYDLSNDLFGAFLDESMTYSSALFDGGQDLPAAQLRKMDRLLDATGVGPSTRLLEIGTGWGALAVRAAERGATVHTITLSEQQLRGAEERVARAGLTDRVTIELRDYRDLDASRRYDAIVSVEMVEAVGERYWPGYFRLIDRILAPGGTAGVQSITMADERLAATRRTYTWMHKYIFPGGLIPSIPAIQRVLERHTGLAIDSDLAFGPDYARTLDLWRHRFAEATGGLARRGFDDLFARTWDFYLAYSQAGFTSGYLDVHQFTLRRKP
ncbi:cyclopropane-fatty-acyl-phospholipid synthase family protein [Phytomonospora sp. NPDC050363]|uniref:cyclopropane-fatty-acyl-phospholipid synthase family protein n=1 Tax=Phytomonospora sp. NPDC050363 TaxID=3155642 RepID=UPI00340C1401